MLASDWKYLGVFFFALCTLILAAEWIRKSLHWPAETCRKSVHLLTGLLVATTPFLLRSKWPMVILGALFALINYLAIKRGLLQGMHDARRRSYGTVFYPISFVLLVLLLWDHNRLVLVTAMLILAIADTLAATVGQHAKRPIAYHLGSEAKTLQGSAAMAVTTFLIVVVSLFGFRKLYPLEIGILYASWTGLVVALIATASEAISFKGSDNLTIPLAAAFSLHYMLSHSTADAAIFSLGMGLALLIAVVSYQVRFLDGSGAVATFLLGTVVFGLGRWSFSIPMLTFFVLSSLLSKMGRKRKAKAETLFEKGGRRDVWQVLANGGLAGVILLVWHFYPADLFYLLFLGALAGVTADTWATEIGILSKSAPRSLLNWKVVPIGTSGGVSLLGTMGAALGSLVLGAAGALSSPHSSTQLIGSREILLVLVSGFLASFIDSLLGASFQAQFCCPQCGKLTEKVDHCAGMPTRFVRGLKWMNNDVVNGICGLSGVAFAWLGWRFWL